MSEAALKQGYTIRDGELFIEDLAFSEIAKHCPTPLYIYSQTRLEQTMDAFLEGMKSGRFQTRVLFASKSFNVKAMLELVNEKGLGLDVVSAGELYTAKTAGFNMKKVVFHGNNKSAQELSMALEYGVGTIVADNLQEIRLLCEIAKSHPAASCDILMRINPGVEAHTHSYIVTAHVDSKFGMLFEDLDDILEGAQAIENEANLHFKGFHAHIGSQIFEPEAFRSEIDVMAGFAAEFEKVSSLSVETLDLGGGFAAWYTEADQPIEISRACTTILDACAQAADQYHLEALKNIWIEPGRSIVANAGATLYRVGFVKKTPHKTYYFVDGGMNDNIRPALYDADYSCDLVQRMDEQKTETVCVAGKCCESGDILVKSASLPEASRNDLLIVYTTGAYGYSMASHYNKLPVPGVLFVKGKEARYVVRPETLDDLIARETDEKVI